MTQNHKRPMVDVQDEQNRAKFQSYSDILDLCQSKMPPPSHSREKEAGQRRQLVLKTTKETVHWTTNMTLIY